MAIAYSALGALVVVIIVFVLYLDDRPDLAVWHEADLDEEFKSDSGVETFADYLALEERLFAQLDSLVYDAVEASEPHLDNRYSRNGRSDPARWSPNWNRSFELRAANPEVGVLLLHGMSDSPYSLHSLGQRLNAQGALVVGLRVPGHGTAPSGLVEVTWQDMAAAVRLGVRHLVDELDGRPLYIVGYSNGAALAVHYALSALEDDALTLPDGLALISPAIGVSSVAALAVWQARLGHLLGLEKLAWNSILPEYDPFKYGSFAVNAGDLVYRLTREIQDRVRTLDAAGGLHRFPPLLAFSSAVDATVSTPALVHGLFERLPKGGHELVLFDVNRMAEMLPIFRDNPTAALLSLRDDADRAFTLSLVTNETAKSARVVVRIRGPGNESTTEHRLGLAWRTDIYSLSHVALPFSPGDPLYGGEPREKSPGIRIGDMALRGERGVLWISASEMLRLRWNPFYPYLEGRVLRFIRGDRPQGSHSGVRKLGGRPGQGTAFSIDSHPASGVVSSG